MACQREMLLHLEELGVQDQRHRVFLPVDGTGLERGEEFGERHRRGHGAEQLEGTQMRRVRRGADLQPAQIGGRRDRAAVVGEVAPADLPGRERLQIGGLEFAAQAIADRAIHHCRGMVAALDQKGQVEHIQFWREPGEERVAGQADVERAAADGADRLGIGAQRAVGKDLDLEAPVGLFLDAFGEQQGRLVPAVGFRMRMREAQLRALGHGGAADGEERDAGTGTAEGSPAGERHGILLCCYRFRRGRFSGRRTIWQARSRVRE